MTIPTICLLFNQTEERHRWDATVPLINVFHFLDAKSLCMIELTNKALEKAVHDTSVWTHLAKNAYHLVPLGPVYNCNSTCPDAMKRRFSSMTKQHMKLNKKLCKDAKRLLYVNSLACSDYQIGRRICLLSHLLAGRPPPQRDIERDNFVAYPRQVQLNFESLKDDNLGRYSFFLYLEGRKKVNGRHKPLTLFQGVVPDITLSNIEDDPELSLNDSAPGHRVVCFPMRNLVPWTKDDMSATKAFCSILGLVVYAIDRKTKKIECVYVHEAVTRRGALAENYPPGYRYLGGCKNETVTDVADRPDVEASISLTANQSDFESIILKVNARKA